MEINTTIMYFQLYKNVSTKKYKICTDIKKKTVPANAQSAIRGYSKSNKNSNASW